MKAVANTTSAPLVVTDEGRVLGIGEFAAVDSDARTRALLDSGDLREITGSPSKDMDPSAAEALKTVADSKKKEA